MNIAHVASRMPQKYFGKVLQVLFVRQVAGLAKESLSGVVNYWRMPARKRPTANNHLQEAMALLIRNQAAFVEQIARNDQERLALQRSGDERQLRIDKRFLKIEEWQRKSDEQFGRIEERLAKIEADLLELPKIVVQTILDQLPRIRKEIGFKTQK